MTLRRMTRCLYGWMDGWMHCCRRLFETHPSVSGGFSYPGIAERLTHAAAFQFGLGKATATSWPGIKKTRKFASPAAKRNVRMALFCSTVYYSGNFSTVDDPRSPVERRLQQTKDCLPTTGENPCPLLKYPRRYSDDIKSACESDSAIGLVEGEGEKKLRFFFSAVGLHR